jgi:hypothetical protein
MGRERMPQTKHEKTKKTTVSVLFSRIFVFFAANCRLPASAAEKPFPLAVKWVQ